MMQIPPQMLHSLLHLADFALKCYNYVTLKKNLLQNFLKYCIMHTQGKEALCSFF